MQISFLPLKVAHIVFGVWLQHRISNSPENCHHTWHLCMPSASFISGLQLSLENRLALGNCFPACSSLHFMGPVRNIASWKTQRSCRISDPSFSLLQKAKLPGLIQFEIAHLWSRLLYRMTAYLKPLKWIVLAMSWVASGLFVFCNIRESRFS